MTSVESFQNRDAAAALPLPLAIPVLYRQGAYAATYGNDNNPAKTQKELDGMTLYHTSYKEWTTWVSTVLFNRATLNE